ncbi:helix-turn-helix domain-containing protein [Adlercreutzia sp. R21]|uniref:helix-turn-helix domain-containing protein n=1 Tax=Adlercreutzia wanghongyangiae TaxID=3111451 RepID=UPI002DBD0A86|nr:helix-turn-helix domain-containing protein [Adlercreutzia sp. R21]MEC4185465.1 helix-turn-helix domain-containing protein [Adlercreutzia sp. R21]
MKYGMDVRAEAVRYFEMGFANKIVGRLLGIPHGTVKRWLYAYRALGKEALFVTKHKTYSHDLKVEAARAVTEGRMSKPEAMAAYGVKGRTQINEWCRLYREGGADALLPKPKGRPKKTEPAFSSREEELEARVRELELELEIQKRINALAEEIERRRRTR